MKCIATLVVALATLGMLSVAQAAPPTTPTPTPTPTPIQTQGVTPDNLPAMADAMRARMRFPMAWNGQVSELARWRQAGIAKVWELSLQAPDTTPFAMEVLDEVDRGSYWARKIAFNLTTDSRVLALLLVPKGAGPFPGAVLYHDHGARFDIGKEKWIQPWGDDARLASATQWAAKYFSGRFVGDALARRGYVVLATDALGWGDRGPMTYEQQQALAANFANLGSSLAGLMALEDVRAAEFLASIPQVRPGQVAALGFSMGAFRAWQAAALSDTIAVTVAAHWMASAPALMVPGNNQLRGASAWTMVHPGLLRLLDYPDVAALAAPKPLLLYSGAQDALLPQAAVQPAFAQMRRVWMGWQADKNLEIRVWPDAHTFGQQQQEAAFDWLDRQWRPPR